MELKVIQINIWKGAFLDALLDFFRHQDPDIITLQEVTGGTENRHGDRQLDLFTHLQRRLGLSGALAVEWRVAQAPGSYSGKAILTKGEIVRHQTIWLHPYRVMSPREDRRDYPSCPRNVLDCTVRLGGTTFHVLSAHGAWTKAPVDTPHKLRQAHRLARHLSGLQPEPFILGGDLNLPPQARVIKILETVATNATTLPIACISRTTHPTIHATAASKPAGLLVDYIFVSPHFTVTSIDAPVVTVSDHLPVVATLELR